MSSCIHFTYYIFKVYSFQEYDKDIGKFQYKKNVLFRFKIRNNEQKSWVDKFQEKDQVFENKI